MNDWIATTERLPENSRLVETKVEIDGKVTNETKLRYDKEWLTPFRAPVNVAPTHWRKEA